MRRLSTPRNAYAALAVAAVCAAIAGGCSAQPPATDPNPAPASASAASSATTRPPTPAVADPNHVGVKLSGTELCQRAEDGSLLNPIEPGTYKGLLRNAPCRQVKFDTMAQIATALGVDCNHCHVADPNDPKREIYEEWTDNKRTANWMEATFIQGLQSADGKPMMCRSCHRNDAGKGLAKILKQPRDTDFAQVWMHEVMTTQFSERNGKRLKCRTCHVGMAPGQPGWLTDVVKQVELTPDGFRRKP